MERTLMANSHCTAEVSVGIIDTANIMTDLFTMSFSAPGLITFTHLLLHPKIFVHSLTHHSL